MRFPKESRIVTIAAIRRGRKEGVTEYLFNESQRIFTIPSSINLAREYSSIAEGAFKKKEPIKVRLDTRLANIQKIAIPTSRELQKFKTERILVEKPEKTFPINVKKIDPTKFNLVDYYLKIPIFKLCIKTVPNYSKAKEIFDYCAKQSCHLPGPYDISHCIPFQYVKDGCYARAHKMRWIITTKFGYCCEKVFSFANQNYDQLAVKADKWGGCCVMWWYHVAPLIRVKVKLLNWNFVLAMVIDPGMFDKPVLLSTWLSAQENTMCTSYANVSMYTIQPGSAYAPANYYGTAFSTDSAYTSTDATLIAYKNLSTCP
jgi:hypothetical protein